MERVLKNLQPQSVFGYFEDISQIPRGSGNEKAISDWLVDFAKSHGLEVIQDQVLNVIIKKPATPGYEKAPTVILQGHMDMVNEKNKETVHDFEKDPIKLRIVEDMIYATDTTLGADNGIAVAYALAILASKDIPHPAIEVLLTVDEESTMGGAQNLDGSHFAGRMLVNIDSEEEGKLLVSSAGGVRGSMILPVEWQTAESGMATYRLKIGGLKGGHSGIEINKGRGNANKLLGRILNDLKGDITFYINEMNGGVKPNAIPREAEIILSLNPQEESKLHEKVEAWDGILKNELRAADAGVFVQIEKTETSAKVFSKESTNKLVAALMLLPSGVLAMSMAISGLVESSTNLGVVTMTEKGVKLVNEIRSSVNTLKKNTLNQVKALAEVLGGEVIIESEYPEWEYNPDSELRGVFQKVYKDMTGKDAEIVAIHAGLECGVLMKKIPGLDAISIGPNLYDVHTPEEHLSISSTQKVWEYLLEVLKQMKTLG